MKIKELKKLIENLSDEDIVVVDAFDHSYRACIAEVRDAWFDSKYKGISEYYGPEYTNGPGKVIKVLHVGG